jgi:hypothetical protein
MFIIGGNSSHDLFLKDNTINDIHYLDLKTLAWTNLKVTGSVPTYLAYNYSEQLDDKHIIVFWCD